MNKYRLNDAAGLDGQGPRHRMNRSCITLAMRISSYVSEIRMKKQWDTGVYTGSCESGDDKRASMASKDANVRKYKDYCADRLKGLFG